MLVARVHRAVAIVEYLAQGANLEACVAIVANRWEWGKVPALLLYLLGLLSGCFVIFVLLVV